MQTPYPFDKARLFFLAVTGKLDSISGVPGGYRNA
jgi:hypothetical protein